MLHFPKNQRGSHWADGTLIPRPKGPFAVQAKALGENPYNCSYKMTGITISYSRYVTIELIPGTIVGSAVFNILFVIGMCGLLSHEVLQLTWWPLFRDCSFYIISLVFLIYSFLDAEVQVSGCLLQRFKSN